MKRTIIKMAILALLGTAYVRSSTAIRLTKFNIHTST